MVEGVGFRVPCRVVIRVLLGLHEGLGTEFWALGLGAFMVDFGPGGFKQVLLSSRSGSYLEFSSPNRELCTVGAFRQGFRAYVLSAL